MALLVENVPFSVTECSTPSVVVAGEVIVTAPTLVFQKLLVLALNPDVKGLKYVLTIPW